MANRWSTQFFATLEKKPFQLACNFVVDATNGNGFGVRSLKGPGISRVYMNTSASFTGTLNSNTTISAIASGTSSFRIGGSISGSNIPAGTVIVAIPTSGSLTISQAATATGAQSINYAAPGSPNPTTGLIVVVFQDNFNRYLFGTSGFVSPVSGTPISISTGSSLTVGHVYTIVSVGTTTTVQWNAVGMPVGIVPAVGVSFIATATSGSGTGIVETSTNSGITSIEVVGDPNMTITSQAATVLGVTSGAYMILQCLGPTDASTTTLIPKAPAAGTVVGLSFFMSNSVITVQGQ